MPKPTKPKVLIGIPTMAAVHPDLMMAVLLWMADAFNTGDYQLTFYYTTCVQPVDNARNEIVKAFLMSDSTHLFFIDSDTVPPRDAIRKMLKADKDIVTGITPIVDSDDGMTWRRRSNVYDMDDKPITQGEGLVRAKLAGSSCILIKRAVFEKMPIPHYRFVYEDTTGKQTCVSEDIHFTVQAMSAGFEMWCDKSVICKHYKATMW